MNHFPQRRQIFLRRVFGNHKVTVFGIRTDKIFFINFAAVVIGTRLLNQHFLEHGSQRFDNGIRFGISADGRRELAQAVHRKRLQLIHQAVMNFGNLIAGTADINSIAEIKH